MHAAKTRQEAERLLITGKTIGMVAKKVSVAPETVGWWRAKLARQGLVPKNGHVRYPAETRQEAERLLVEGKTVGQVADIMDTTFQAVSGWRAGLIKKGLLQKLKLRYTATTRQEGERLLMQGLTIREVADKITVSPPTVNGWRTELVQQGLIPKREKGLKSKTFWKNKVSI